MSEGLNMNQLQERNALLVTENETIKAQRDALAAENAALRDVLEDIVEPQSSVLEREHRIRAENALKTPATDAYLNSVRAEGLEMFGNSNSCPDEFCVAVNDFANQLRAGEPS